MCAMNVMPVKRDKGGRVSWSGILGGSDQSVSMGLTTSVSGMRSFPPLQTSRQKSRLLNMARMKSTLIPQNRTPILTHECCDLHCLIDTPGMPS